MQSMTSGDWLPDVPNGSHNTWQSIEDAAQRDVLPDKTRIDEIQPELHYSRVGTTEIGSEYSDFASDEEEILNNLLGNIAPQSLSTDAPLLVTDIEDYEEPRGVHIPKVLGVERSIPPWVLRGQIQDQGQTPHDGASSHIENPEGCGVGTKLQDEYSHHTESEIESTEPNTRSPLERFRRPPNKALSVTDLASPAWCELQYFYTLSKHGRKRRTPAMRQGTKIHKTLEDEVHTTVPVDIVTQEDKWGLRIWNVIQGLRTLRDTGLTRELEIWGMIGGEIVNGVVDELSYDCPDPKLKAQIDERYSNAQQAKEALPEYQTTITDYLLSAAGGSSQPISEADDVQARAQNQQSTPPPPAFPGKERERFVYITDIKTRGVKTLPAGASIRPTVMQLHLYHHMVENLTYNNFSLQALAERYALDTKSAFSDSFIVQVGSLNQEFFDTVTEQDGVWEDKVTASQIASSQDSTDVLLRHSNLSSLWALMIQHFQQTFLQNATLSVPATPSSRSQSIHDIPAPSTRLSPILTAKYLSSKTSELLGNKSILFDPSLLKSYLEDNLSWWRGERSARGVELQEAWKCRSCDFRDDCSWIHERDAAAVAEANARKKMRELAGVELNTSRSKV